MAIKQEDIKNVIDNIAYVHVNMKKIMTGRIFINCGYDVYSCREIIPGNYDLNDAIILLNNFLKQHTEFNDSYVVKELNMVIGQLLDLHHDFCLLYTSDAADE